MKILAIETATEACSAALMLDDAVTERFRVAPREHTKLILPMVDSLLKEAGLALKDLDALAFGRGPGSFTGVRIAAGIIQGLALGTDLPVVPVSSLAAMAHNYLIQKDLTTVFAALDARMEEVYWGVYQKDRNGIVRLSGEEAVVPAGEVKFAVEVNENSAGVGSGWASYTDILSNRLGSELQIFEPDWYPHAASVAQLGADGYRNNLSVSAEKALPVYLRDKVARKKGQ